MNELIKHNELTPASFSDADKLLTKGQEHLLQLLKDRIKDKMPITQQDIIDVYFKAVSRNGETIRVRGNLSYSAHFFCEYHQKSSTIAKRRANTWFKHNLGSCIIKGKLLVIPIIEIKTGSD